MAGEHRALDEKSSGRATSGTRRLGSSLAQACLFRADRGRRAFRVPGSKAGIDGDLTRYRIPRAVLRTLRRGCP